MFVYTARNVHEAFPWVLSDLLLHGNRRDSRNGPVLRFPEPVTVEYLRPTERVLFWPDRDANPFFHLFESLWMLAGRNDVAFPATYARQIMEYSEDGLTLAGAYGWRWRKDGDQLGCIVQGLKNSHDCRRQVLQMWSSSVDLGREGKDLPCNLTATFQINDHGALDMVVFQRSGDLIWGTLGANAVHFSVLQEYVACAVGVPVGRYSHVCVNLHVYCNEVLERCRPVALAEPSAWTHGRHYNPYDASVFAVPLWRSLETHAQFDAALRTYFDCWDRGVADTGVYGVEFIDKVVVPMERAHRFYREGRLLNTVLSELSAVAAGDWRSAAVDWMLRRKRFAKEV